MAQEYSRNLEVQVPVVFSDPANGRGAMFDKSAVPEALPKMMELLRYEGESRGAVVNQAYYDRNIEAILKSVESQYQAWLEMDDAPVGFVMEVEMPGGSVITLAKPEMLMLLNVNQVMDQAPKATAPTEEFRVG